MHKITIYHKTNELKHESLRSKTTDNSSSDENSAQITEA